MYGIPLESMLGNWFMELKCSLSVFLSVSPAMMTLQIIMANAEMQICDGAALPISDWLVGILVCCPERNRKRERDVEEGGSE